MRKISKSRTEEEVMSSTNGSISAELENNDESIHKNDDDDGNASDSIIKDDENDESGRAKRKSKGAKKSIVDYLEEDDNDAEGSEDAGSSGRPKRKSKGAKKSTDDGHDDYDDANGNSSDDAPKSKKSKTKSKKKKTKAQKKQDSDPEDDEEEEDYEVEKVIDSKKIGGKLHYLIRWKGYSAADDSWEAADAVNCPDLIAKYEETAAKSGGKSSSKKGGKRSKKTKASSPAKKAKNNDWDAENADEDAEYEVEKILEVHFKKSGKREFLIHWKGWSAKFDSWEPEEHLNCQDLIKKFMDKVDKAQKVSAKSLRVAPKSTKRFTLQAGGGGRRLSKRHPQNQRVRYDDAE